MLPFERTAQVLSGIILPSDTSSDTGEVEDNEWEKSLKTRHWDALGKDDSFLTKVLNHFTPESERIGDRGADDIHTPPPDARV